MKKLHQSTLFLFHRDLRITDNIGLIHALANSQTVTPCFIFDPAQVGPSNKFRSMNAIQFMIESLKDLDGSLKKDGGKLYLFYGKTVEQITAILRKNTFDALYHNRDYTPFAIQRDTAIEQLCRKKNIAYASYHDTLLNEPELIKTGNGTPYEVFTSFYKKASRDFPVALPMSMPDYYSWNTALENTSDNLTMCDTILDGYNNPHAAVHGGRANAMKIVKKLSNFDDYQKKRDLPSVDNGTTLLSAYLKFGCISVRELHKAISDSLGFDHPLIRQLYWRDFYSYIAYHAPYVYGQAYHTKYNRLWWRNDMQDFKRWCTGTTGFPIVDAGMQQLNQTGFMHNRVRMIVASFLTKDLHIDWQWGEHYFAQQLIDYDPAVNNGNWQWSASTGCDAAPYFRIFNPWLQQKKFDPECTYIKRWIPALKSVPSAIIHTLFKQTDYDIKGYPKPMLDHQKEVIITKNAFKKAAHE